jgi:predicted nucleic acid-binding protein
MTACFADTAYFIALVSPTDFAHAEARAQAAVAGRSIFTTSAVLNEFGNHFAKPPNRTLFTSFVDSLRANSAFELVHVDERLFDAGLNLYRLRSDKLWSLTDCISFVVMQDLRLTDVLSTDHHFQQAGFRVLLSTTP